MPIRSRLINREFSQMEPFVNELAQGVREEIESSLVPLRNEISFLQTELNSLRSLLDSLQQTSTED
jgi:predicted glycosyltransferase